MSIDYKPPGGGSDPAIDDILPTQTGNSGEFLTTNGSAASWAAVSSGAVVQVKNLIDSTLATFSSVLPIDNTIPQNTEGTQVMSLAITPTSATNKLKITVVYNYSPSGNYASACALFQDSTANALAASSGRALSGSCGNIVIVHYMTAGTTSATTFKVRGGVISGGGTDTYNGTASAALFGGIYYSSITIEELVP